MTSSLHRFGAFTRSQVSALGFSEDAINHSLRSGQWRRAYRGVYRLERYPVTWEQRALAATLLVGAGSATSHSTAAFLHKLSGFGSPPRRIDVTAAHQVRQLSDRKRHEGTVRFHRSACELGVQLVRGIPTTGLARTLLDLAACTPEATFEIALDSALRDVFFEQELDAFMAANASHKGVPPLARLLSKRFGTMESPLETRVARALRESGLPLPKSRIIIEDSHGPIMRVDLVWQRQGVAGHIDSFQHHGHRAAFHNDASLRARLAAIGWYSFTFTEEMLRTGAWKSWLGALLASRDQWSPGPAPTTQLGLPL